MRRSSLYSLIAVVVLAVVALGATILSGNKPLLGLDLQGGASLVLKPEGQVSNGVLDQAISIIRRRVDALGVAEPDISRQGSTVVIELPGIKNPQDALQTVGQTAELRFRPMLCNVAPAAAQATSPGTTTTTTPGSPTTTTPAPSATTRPAATPSSTAPSGTGLGPIRGAGAGAHLTAELTQATTAPATTTPATTAPATTTPTTAPATTTTTSPPSVATTPQLTPSQYDANTCALLGADGGSNLPTTPKALDDSKKGGGYAILEGTPQKNQATARYLVGPTQATGRIVSTASAQPPDLTNGEPNWFVLVNFTGSGSAEFDNLAKANYQKQLAIVLDGVVVSAPDHPDSSPSTAPPPSPATSPRSRLRTSPCSCATDPCRCSSRPRRSRRCRPPSARTRSTPACWQEAIGLALVLALHDLLLPGPRAWWWWSAWPSRGPCSSRSSPPSARPVAWP